MHIERMHKAMETLSEWLLCECGKGMDCFDVCAAGQVADMLKDLAEASKECEEKMYYEEITKAMKKEAEDEYCGRMGYDNWRYASGRFAPTGRGHRSGYRDMWNNDRYGHMPMDIKMYDPEYDYADMMGYTYSGSSERNGNSGGRWTASGNYGYNNDRVYGYDHGNDMNNGRMGYSMYDNYPTKYGTGYDSYKMAKKHYTETKNESDKTKMNEKINETVVDSVEVLREMWKDASPDTKQKMKQQIDKLHKEVMAV